MFGAEQGDVEGELCVPGFSPTHKALLCFIPRDECDKNTQNACTGASLGHCRSFSDFCPKVCKVLLHT